MTLLGGVGLSAGAMGSLVRQRWSGRRVASCQFTVPQKLLPPDLHRLSRSTKAGESRAMRTRRGDRHHTDERAGGADWTQPVPSQEARTATFNAAQERGQVGLGQPDPTLQIDRNLQGIPSGP